MTSKAVVVLSGGLDSTTLLHYEMAQGWDCIAVSFDYGQRHRRELEFAANTCRVLGVSFQVVELYSVREAFLAAGSLSSLVYSEVDVPEGHYGEESMKATIVPNRNMIMLSIAAGIAVSAGASRIATGVHAGDHYIYPDCRPGFIQQTEYAIQQGNEDESLHIDAPFMYLSKNDIAQKAFDLNVDIANTWSCYKGGFVHCGKCGTCVERLEAIASTGNPDPTPYADDQYWREALRRPTV